MENMDTINGEIIEKGGFNWACRYEIVDEFPAGYMVWNIGRENFPYEGFVPLAKPREEGSCMIDRNSLKAIKTDNATANAILFLAHRYIITKERYEYLTDHVQKSASDFRTREEIR